MAVLFQIISLWRHGSPYATFFMCLLCHFCYFVYKSPCFIFLVSRGVYKFNLLYLFHVWASFYFTLLVLLNAMFFPLLYFVQLFLTSPFFLVELFKTMYKTLQQDCHAKFSNQRVRSGFTCTIYPKIEFYIKSGL